MGFLPSYQDLKNQLPLSDSQRNFIDQSRQNLRRILAEKDSRLLLIMGPCSIHDRTSALEFALQLKKLSSSVSNQFFILMRAYFEKPRTSAGWKGFLYDPYLDGSNDIKTGIYWSRQLLLELARLQIPVATEFLDPITAFYYDDLITWGSIGARTSSSQPHRQLASSLHMPIGFKNGVAGNVSAAINGVISAAQNHTFMGLNEKGLPSIMRSRGNPDVHIVLRGGESGPNFDRDSIAETLQKLQQAHLPSQIIVDCSHQNSGKRYENQPFVFQSVLEQVAEGNTSIRGLMLESHLLAGSQCLLGGPSSLKFGISITDSCLDWHTSEKLILQGAQLLTQHQAVEEEVLRPTCAFVH